MKFHQNTILLFAIGIFAQPVVAQSQPAHEFKWDNLVIAAAKMDEHFDYEANTDWYMEHFRPDVWRNAHNDEFKMQDKRVETEEIFRNKVEGFDLDREFVLRSTLTLGEYDFKKEMFPIKGMNEGYHWLDRSYKNGNFPGRYSVFPSNIEILNRLPMTKEQARAFVNSRKDRYGRVDRRIYVKFTIKLREMRDRSSFACEIQQGRFYLDRSYTQQVGTEIKKAVADSRGKLESDKPSQNSHNTEFAQGS